MKNTPKRRKYYTFMLLPHDAQGRPLQLKVPVAWVRTAALVAIFSFLVVGSSIVYSTFVSRRLIHYTETISKNQEQQKVIESYSMKTNEVVKAIDELVRKDNELRRILGLKGWQSKLNLATIKGSSEVRVDEISLELNLVKARLSDQRESLQELKNWVSYVRSRFAAT